MYRFFFSIPEDAFILCIGFFYRFRKMLLEAEIIDSVFYVCHLRYTYIYIMCQCVQLPKLTSWCGFTLKHNWNCDGLQRY